MSIPEERMQALHSDLNDSVGHVLNPTPYAEALKAILSKLNEYERNCTIRYTVIDELRGIVIDELGLS